MAFLPDLIITDIEMPLADGSHLILRCTDTPGIGHADHCDDRLRTGNATFSLAQGADAYEPKPIDPAQLLETVRRLLL